MKQREYKLPSNSSALRIKHFDCFNLWHDDEMSIPERVHFVASFLGISPSEVWTIEKKVFDKMYNHIESLIAFIKIEKNPPQIIVMDGIEYELINPEKVGIAWFQDWNLCDMKKDPAQLACLFYHPKGNYYGETDRNEVLIHPFRWKKPIFEQHLPLGVFISCARFFLESWLRSTKKSTETKIWEKRTIKSLKQMSTFFTRNSSMIE